MKNTIVFQTLSWIARSQLLVATAILLFVASAIGVVYSAHMTRFLYADLQSLQKDADDVDSEYERLLLEQSAWADYTRIDQLAREELDMRPPAQENLVVVYNTAEVGR